MRAKLCPQGFDKLVSLPLMGPYGLLSGHNFPAFRFRFRRTFNDADLIADLESVLFIVSPVLFGLTDGFLHNRMREAAFD